METMGEQTLRQSVEIKSVTEAEDVKRKINLLYCDVDCISQDSSVNANMKQS